MAAVKPRAREPLSSFSTSPVRSTRCGMPSTRVETTVPSSADCEIALLDRVGHGGIRGQQEAGAHRHAGGAVATAPRRARGRRRSRPRRSPECLTASSTDGSSSVVATGPVWPPPSPPCTITASAPQPATLLGVLGRADRRNHHDAGVFELRDQLWLGRQRERGHLDAFADHQVDAVAGVAGVGADVDAERLVGGCLDLGDRGLPVRRASWWPTPGCPGRRRWRSPTPAARRPPSPSRSAPPGARCRSARSAACASCHATVFPCRAAPSDR